MGHQRLSKTKKAAQSPQEQAKNSARSQAHPVEKLQAAIGNRAVSRQIQAQRHSNPPAPMQAKPQFAGVSRQLTDDRQPGEILRASSSSGKPMPESVRQKMETAFNTDFSDVRIHEGPEANSIGALAYTRGNHIHFQPGKYSPITQTGQQLLGHELSHVVQQRAGRVAVPQAQGAPINSDSALEAEADRLGAKAARGESAEQVINPAAASPSQQSVPPIQCVKSLEELKEEALKTGSTVTEATSTAAPVIADTLSQVGVGNSIAGGIGLGGLLSLVSATKDAREAFKAFGKGEKGKAAASGSKAGLGFTAGGTDTAKNILQITGSGAASTVGYVAGGAGIALGAVETGLGGYSIHKATSSYHNVKDIARQVARDPSSSSQQPAASPAPKLTTQQITERQKELITELALKEKEIGAKQPGLDAKKSEFLAKQPEVDLLSDEQEVALLFATAELSILEAERDATLKEMNSLTGERADLERRNDVLEVALELLIILKKVKNRATLNTVRAAGQTVGGSLAVAGAAGAGIGAIPGIAVTAGFAAIKPGAWAVRKAKQTLRDRQVAGFDPNKTTANKQQQRSRIADLLADRSSDTDMQNIFKKLPVVSKREFERYSSGSMPTEEIQEILKRRG